MIAMVILTDNLFHLTSHLNVDKSDTITIYYDANIFYDVSYEVTPKGSGQIRANNILIGDTIMTVTYPFNESVSLEAIATNGWRFSHWDKQTNILNPSEDNLNVGYAVSNLQIILKRTLKKCLRYTYLIHLHQVISITYTTTLMYQYSVQGVKYKLEVFNRFGELYSSAMI